MHRESYEEMWQNLTRYCGEALREPRAVVDVGSRDINGTYRGLMPGCWSYLGLDLGPGRNVDRVMPSAFDTGLADGYADIVLCGQVLEHCTDPPKLVREIARILRPGGWCFLVAPAVWVRHRFPVDCWRILRDGMRALIQGAGLECLTGYERPLGRHGWVDCWGVGRKPKQK